MNIETFLKIKEAEHKMNELQKRRAADEADKQNAEATERHDTMVYKYPGPHKVHGDGFDYTVVAAKDVEAMCKAGWSKTTPEAKEAHLNAKIEEAKAKVVADKPKEPAKKKPGRPFKKAPSENGVD